MADIASNIHIIIVLALVVLVLLYAMYVVIKVVKRRTRIRDANREISLLKMDLLSKQAHLENLIGDSVEWTDKDLKSFDETLEDSKILKTKLDKGMEVADVRTKRLELGSQTVELFDTLEKIRGYEGRMFGPDKRKGG
ncbi:MAG: hypothetical protein ACMUIG_02800 [Thermoplasmatota archaeon]